MTARTRRRLLCLAVVPIAAAAAVLPVVVPPARAGGASSLPYALDGPLPSVRTSPPVDPRAPYTPTVLSLIKQLEPDTPPTVAELANAAKLFEGLLAQLGTGPSSCKAVGAVNAPTGTTPSITPLCWADAVGVNIVSGPNIGQTSATAEPLALAASFDPALANVWGQVEGLEGRQLMVTGLYGPEVDTSVQPNWERGLDTLGEDPFLNGELAAAQVNGMQSQGLMSQVKHFAGFTGANRYTLTQVTDQQLHEILLAPFEKSLTSAQAASVMCAYEEYQDLSTHLPGPQNALYPASPYAGSTAPRTWPLNEKHWACEQPLALNYVLRQMWHSTAFVGSDYPAIHSTAAMTQGAAQEFPQSTFFSASDPTDPSAPLLTVGRGNDPTGDTCVLEVATVPAPCSATGARHIGGIGGTGCNPDNGCGLVTAVATGNFPLSVFNQALAEALYQEERFGLLGCDDSPRSSLCTNPGGVNGDRSGNAAVPAGPSTGATAATDLGTKAGDAAVVERIAEEGAVLLKNTGSALPLTTTALQNTVAVSGAGAEYLVAAPSNEASTGFPDRIAINPLQQLKALSPTGSKVTFTPAVDPTGLSVPSTELSTTSGTVDGGLTRTAGPGSPGKDPTLDFTTVSSSAQLTAGDYTWSGYIYAPREDDYTFRFQSTPNTTPTPNQPVSFSLDGQPQTLSAASSFYCGQYYGHNVCVPVGVTNAGYTQAGLTNQQAPKTHLTAGYHAVSTSFRNDTNAPASFRFAYSRDTGDALDAAAAARGKAAAVVFVNDNGIQTIDQDAYTPPTTGVAALPNAQVQLINAVAAANSNTIVVMNTADPVIVKPWIDNPNVKAVLQMWNAGSEGGTATARLLLGQANPGGHTTITWPANPQDTIWGYNQTKPLYPADTTGPHPERLNGTTNTDDADCNSYLPAPSPCTKTQLTQGIYSGYRYHDQQGLTPEFPFGYGLTYTNFRFSGLKLTPSGSGTDVSFTVTNTGTRAGTEVAQVYVGAGPQIPGVQQAVRSLRGFQRLTLQAGQAQKATIHLDARAFQYWDEMRQQWTTDPGQRRIWVGDANAPANLPLSGTTTISGT
jgi:beta-glucosidase